MGYTESEARGNISSDLPRQQLAPRAKSGVAAISGACGGL